VCVRESVGEGECLCVCARAWAILDRPIKAPD
jgi:hypothetical protein